MTLFSRFLHDKNLPHCFATRVTVSINILNSSGNADCKAIYSSYALYQSQYSIWGISWRNQFTQFCRISFIMDPIKWLQLTVFCQLKKSSRSSRCRSNREVYIFLLLVQLIQVKILEKEAKTDKRILSKITKHIHKDKVQFRRNKFQIKTQRCSEIVLTKND